MKKVVLLIQMYFIILILLAGCIRKPTEPVSANKTPVIEAMEEIDQLIGGLITSNAYESVTGIPDIEAGNSQAKPVLIPFGSGAKLARTDSSEADYFFLLIEGIFFTRGTYTYDGEDWTFKEDTTKNETIFLFPYADTSTGLRHDAMWRFYNMVDTESMSAISFDVTVDGFQFVGITFELTGSVAVVDQSLKPVIDSIRIHGFIKDDEGVRYDINVTINETEMTLVIAEEGQKPLTFDLSGDLGMDLAKRREILSPQSGNDFDFDQMVMAYGDIYILLAPNSEVVGYINYRDEKVADLVLKDQELVVQWNDGREIPLSVYLPQIERHRRQVKYI